MGIANLSEWDKEIYVIAVVTAGDGDDVTFFRSARSDEDKPNGKSVHIGSSDETRLGRGLGGPVSRGLQPAQGKMD